MTVSDAWVDFVAGWCSGAVAVIAIQPVDTILTRIQAAPMNIQTLPTTATSATVTSTVSSLMAQTTTPTQRLRSLWRGASPMISAVPIQNSLLMGGYGLGQEYSEAYAPDYKISAIFTGGLVGGILQSFVMSPVELIKVNQQVAGVSLGQAGTRVLWNAANNLAWKGLGATLLRDGIPHGVWFAAYEMCKNEMKSHYVADDDVRVPLLSGAVAASVAWAVGYPADLIKTQIQASNNSSNDGIVATARQIVRHTGWSGLYRGFGLKLVRSIPSSMIGFTVYEFVKKEVQDSF